jgi:hypothetical protein
LRLLKTEKGHQRVACPPFKPLNEVKVGLFLSFCKQFNVIALHQYDSDVLAALMESHVNPCESLVEAVLMCCKVIYPGEPPWGLANSCCMAPIHFWPPNQWPRVEAPLHICAPPSVPCWPPAEGPTCSEKRAFFLVYRLRSQPASVVWPPFTFIRK